ncbi:hypothetical protein D3C76_1708240 [compost metagenome]
MLISAGDKRVQTPPDQYQFGNILFGTGRHPDGQTDEPVTENTAEEQFGNGCSHLFGRYGKQ